MKLFLKIAIILALLGLPLKGVHSQSLNEWLRLLKPEGKPPIVTNSFASDRLSHGHIWRVYLEANDPDGDMREVLYSVGEGRPGHRYMSFLIKREYRARLKGYVNVIISSPETAGAEWAELILTLYIRDDRGNKSKDVVHPVSLKRGVLQEFPSSPFDSGGLESLGNIWVQLYAPLGD